MDISWKIPAGMRDWLPPEAAGRRDLINRLLDRMALWGYEEIATPLLEYYQVLNKGENGFGPDQLYKFIDRDGSILALRPEMTTPIARIMGSKMKGRAPWRLMYGGEVFRHEDIQAGRQREFGQVGVELIGVDGPGADSEILALAIESLKGAGLENFTVSLGHTGVLAGLLASLSGQDTELQEVRRLILDKDFAGLNGFLERAGLTEEKREQVVGLLTRPLSVKEIKDMVPRLPVGVGKALAEIADIVKLLDTYGYGSFIQIDLSTLRSQTYYTGMVFEIYTPGIGYPIGGGGRYDQLLQRFDRDYPATGFALGVERLLFCLPRNEEKQLLLVAGEVPAEELYQAAAKLREKGLRAVVNLERVGKEEARKKAKEIGAELSWCEGGSGDGI